MAAINSGIGSSFLKFTFSDDDGDILASFRMNPADVKLIQRCQDTSDYFENLSGKVPENAGVNDVLTFNNEIEEKICQLLGYDAKQSLFGLISATSIMADGRMFAVHVMDKIIEAVGPELERRKQSMAAAVAKHTAKYE